MAIRLFVMVTITAYSPGAETYTWDDGEKTDTINVTESRIYTVTGCLSNGQCRSTTFSVEVSPLPKMLRIDGDTKFCPDTFSVLTAHAVDDSPYQSLFLEHGRKYAIHQSNWCRLVQCPCAQCIWLSVRYAISGHLSLWNPSHYVWRT